MISPTSHVTPPVSAPEPTAVRSPTAQTKPQPAAVPADTVQISAAAQALQEATESAAQTTREANAGDIQAKHLLAKEAAEKSNG